MRTRRALYVTSGLLLFGMATHAYVLTGPKWAVNQVPYYINPANADVSQSAALAAIQSGAAAWSMQTNANTLLYYMGQTSGTSLQNNGKNEIFFRNTSNGSTIAETYWWADANNRLIDADIVFYDGGFKFFTGSSGCSSGVYLEDTATHEFGHALGLGHTGVNTATMYPTMGWCSSSWRSLDSDDVAGIEKLYPTGGTTTNTPPSISITAPASNSTFASGSTETFTGSASDPEDGTISSRISWRSSLDGQLGSGASVSAILSSGTHTITASVTDNGGATTTAQRTVTVASAPAPSGSPIALTASGSKVKGKQQVALGWSGATATKVDIFRNGALILTTANDGSQTDALNQRGGGTYGYQVCNTGTTTCSATVTVVF